MEQELTLRIILEQPPAGVDFGVQKGHGNDYETVQTQRSSNKNLQFEFTVRVTNGKDGAPNFLGSFAQGRPSERFVYLDIGRYAGQKGTEWSRRLKIPLRGITWDLIKQSLASPGKALTVNVPGTGKDGGPTCGTVKRIGNFKDWHV